MAVRGKRMMIAKSNAMSLSRRHVLGGIGASGLLLASHPAEALQPVVIGKNGWLFPIWDDPGYIDPRVITQVSGIINDAVRVFRQAKIEMAICLLPAKSRLYADFLPADHKTAPAVEKRYSESFKALSTSGAIIFDQAAFLQSCRKAAPDTDLFFKADTHWLPVGAASAAAAMADQIKAKGHLPPSSQPGVTLSPPQYTSGSFNDLTQLLPAADRPKYPNERYLARSPVTNGAAGLLDDDAPDVVVVGNSFMQPAFGYAATLSSELNRPVGLAWRVHNFSPYWNMLDYLKSPAFTKQRPKLIVWTFHEVDLNTPVESAEVWGDTAMPPADFMAKLRPILGVA
jgi:alginate O-acetyltransferase complex protein AlgJ